MALIILWALSNVVSWNGLVRDPSTAYLNVLALNTKSGTALVVNPTGYNCDIKLPFCSSLSVLQHDYRTRYLTLKHLYKLATLTNPYILEIIYTYSRS
jgi:hypothetical protein